MIQDKYKLTLDRMTEIYQHHTTTRVFMNDDGSLDIQIVWSSEEAENLFTYLQNSMINQREQDNQRK